jgi:membrane fusion protein (multidrug efflux system)
MEDNNINKSNKKKIIVGVSVILFASISIYSYFKYDETYPSTDDAYVNTNFVNVASKVGGYIKKIYVKNNQHINEGDLLFEIDNTDYKTAYDQALANYNSQIEMSNIAKQQTMVQKEQLKKDHAQLIFLESRAKRYQALHKANTISEQEYQSVMTDYSNIKTQINIDNEKYQQYLNGYKYSISKVDVSKAQLDTTKNNLNATKYISPINGYITNMNNLSSGEFINPSQQLFGIISNDNWWIDANFKETQIHNIKVGHKAKIKLDMYNHTFNGIVTSISNASGTTFSLLPAQNATGNWVKVTQRFTVRIKINNEKQYPLRVGASANVTINTK